MENSDLYSLGGFVLANFIAAMPGGIFRPGEWYESLNKPSWRPPNWLFAPVWSVLYIMISVAGWLVWRDAVPGELMLPMVIYGVHLCLNFAWSAFFFGLKRPDWAFFEIIALWLSIVATMVAFYAVNPLSTYLLIPYLLWASFAGYLNFVMWQLNKGTLSKPV